MAKVYTMHPAKDQTVSVPEIARLLKRELGAGKEIEYGTVNEGGADIAIRASSGLYELSYDEFDSLKKLLPGVDWRQISDQDFKENRARPTSRDILEKLVKSNFGNKRRA